MDSGTQALAALERALAAQPARDGEAFSEATEQLCRLRDSLIADGRAGAEPHRRLSALNAVISAVLAGHFPLGTTPWALVRSAADRLRPLVADLSE